MQDEAHTSCVFVINFFSLIRPERVNKMKSLTASLVSGLWFDELLLAVYVSACNWRNHHGGSGCSGAGDVVVYQLCCVNLIC